MKGERGVVVLAALLACMSACEATVTHVRGPDGHDWVAIECRRHAASCYEAAGEECPHGYIVADQSSAYGSVSMSQESGQYNGTVRGTATRTPTGYNVNGSADGRYSGTSLGVSMPVYEGQMLIKCKGEGDGPEGTWSGGSTASESATANRSEDGSPPPPPSAPVEAPRPCTSAFEHVGEMAQLWAKWFGGTPMRATPGRDSFHAACSALDDDAQLCLVEPYAEGHASKCKTMLRELAPGSRESLDRLFLRSPSP